MSPNLHLTTGEKRYSMGSSLGTLTLDLIAKTGGFTGPLDKAERASKKNAAAISRHQKEMTSAINSSVRSLVGWAASFVAFGAVKSFVTNSFAAADAIGKVAATAGITTDTLQEMRHAASLNGVSFEQLDQGMQKFNKSIGELRAGTGTLYTYLQKTDRALLSQVQSAKSTDEALDSVYKSLKNVTNSSDRSALAVAAFGRSGQRLAIMADSYKDLRNEARELGLIIDSDLIKGAEIANDKMDTMASVIKIQLTSAFIELAPLITNVAEGLTTATIAISKFFNPKNETNINRFQQLSDELEGLEIALKDAEETGKESFVTITKNGDIFTNTIGSARAQIKSLKDELGKLPGTSAVDGSGSELSQQQSVEMYKKAMSSLETITQKTYDVMKEEYQRDRDEFIEITGDKITAQAIYNKNIEALNKKLSGDEWGDFGNVLKSTSEKNKQKFELIQKSNSAIAKERDRQLKEDIDKDNNYRQLVEQADIAELNNISNKVKRELALHEYKYDKLKEVYSEGSAELTEIERAEAAERAAILNNNDYWGNYLESFENNMSNMDSIVGDSLNSWTSQFGNFFASAILDSKNLDDAFKTLGMGMVNTIVSAIGQMIAQWLVYKAIKIATDKSTQAAAAPALIANAQMASLQAGINAYASAAAIPIVGFAAAPGAMAAAIATTQPMAAAISALAIAGMAHDGIDSVPETGTWLLKKGERVVTSETSRRLDDVLNRVQSGIDSASIIRKLSNINGTGTTKEEHYHYHSNGVTFLNRSQMRDAARMLLQESHREKTRIGAVG